MSPELTGIAGVIALILLILLRVPVAVALGVCGVLGYAAVDDWGPAFYQLGATPFELASNYELSVIPLFVLMGAVAFRSGLSSDLYTAANAAFAGMRGGLAMGTVGASAAFGAICGSSLATAATFAKVAVPEMRRYGYDDRLSAGAVASGGTLGILIPPSVIMIIYAIIAEQSLTQLYAAGLIPGLVSTLLHVVVIGVIVSVARGWAPPAPSLSLGRRLRDLGRFWQAALLFGLSVGGIYAGLFSPTEAAGVGAFGAIVLGLALRRLNRAALMDAFVETVRTSATLFFIILGALVFAKFIALTRLPAGLVEVVRDAGLTPTVVLLILIVFYLFLGCFLDSLGMILVTVPVFLPMLNQLGVDLVWFGIVLVVVVEMGLITPPVGMNLFVIRAQLPDTPMGKIISGTLPFLAAPVGLVLLLLLFPGLALWLPRQLGF